MLGILIKHIITVVDGFIWQNLREIVKTFRCENEFFF